MTKLQQKLETFFAGFIYVAIGTVVAIQVSAQSNTKAVGPKPNVAATHAASCATETSPDALCTVTPAQPDFKICFSSRHPRCFELQKTKIVQSLNGSGVHDVNLDAKQAEQVTKAVKEYRSWLESKKAPAPTSVCRNVVSVDLGRDHKELCVSGLPKKEMQAKNKALIELLETPPGAKSQR